ncbi:AraC family transcriptional regulator [Mycolicibacterium wolinskyi]|uniref:AraC family transcriptional regulator n=1 Tax=Mycolicibacterium wolinskyi TaxID=59750 RepID=A0A132PDJ1_9MYCO|nr:AraC family transcriptional regulator [Mycolicibacterium wolinskyi]KWX20022.1 AraC family transcriptional regulator [Mycolicibacterium wolinskyi]
MTGPALHRPCRALAPYIDFFGYWQRDDDGETHRSRALPRGAATVIIDVSPRQRVDFYAADGATRLDVGTAFVAGAGSISYVTQIDSAQTVLTVHFRPGGAVPFLDGPLGDLENACVGLTEIWGRDGVALHARLIEATSIRHRITLLEEFLLARMRLRHPALTTVLQAIERNPSMRVADAGAQIGLSPKRLIALFRSEVGVTPKTYLRVRRFQAAMRRLDAGAEGGAEIAADLGYFDQAHFVREFRSFTAMTPTEYVRRRMWLPSHVGINR